MKYVSEKYEQQLADLAETLVNPARFDRVLDAADIALGDTVEFEPVQLELAA